MIRELAQRGWTIRDSGHPTPISPMITGRYPWLPADVLEYMVTFDEIMSPARTSWFTTNSLVEGRTPCSCTWDHWERFSLECADGSHTLETQIRLFWGEHFPIVHSVKTGFGYFAIRSDLAVVSGYEPDFEEASVFAPNTDEFLRLVLEGKDGLLASFI